jgi:hypothetical protein
LDGGAGDSGDRTLGPLRSRRNPTEKTKRGAAEWNERVDRASTQRRAPRRGTRGRETTRPDRERRRGLCAVRRRKRATWNRSRFERLRRLHVTRGIRKRVEKPFSTTFRCRPLAPHTTSDSSARPKCSRCAWPRRPGTKKRP